MPPNYLREARGTMALDSGISWFCDGTKPALQIVIDSIAYSENIPLVLAHASLPNTAQMIVDELESPALFGSLLFDEYSPTLYDFLSHCGGFSIQLDELFRSLATSVFVTRFSYPNPFFRLLTDHRFYRWYFSLRMAKLIAARSSRDNHLIDVGLPFTFAKSEAFAPGHVLLIGPIWVKGDGLAEPQIHQSIENLNTNIFSAWIKHVERNGKSLHSLPHTLYSNEFLLRFMFSRQRTSELGLIDRVKHVTSLAKCILADLPATFDDFPKHSIAKYVGIGSCLIQKYNSSASKEEPSVLTNFSLIEKNCVARRHSMKLEFNGERLITSTVPGNANVEISDPLFDLKRDMSFTTWQSYIYESFVILRNWLSNYFGVWSLGDIFEGVSGVDRLARFICQTFRCDEATLYAIDYEKEGLPLIKFASFTTDSEPEEKLALMYKHMCYIRGQPALRRQSISFRAIDRNRAQHVPCFDPNKTDQLDDDCITYPRDTRWQRWGTSAFAVPVRVNGLIWGSLELISFRAETFPVTIRTKIEEAATILSASLFVQSILRTTSEIATLIYRDDLASDDRMSHTCTKLRSLLFADSIVIFADEGQNALKFVGQSGRPDIERAEYGRFDEGKTYLHPFQAFADRGDDFWTADIGTEAFDVLFKKVKGRKFYTDRIDKKMVIRRLGRSAGKSHKKFVMCFTFPFEVPKDERWRLTQGVVFDFISSVIDALFSDILWEKEVRKKFGHELRRLTGTLIETVSKIESVGRLRPAWLHNLRAASEGVQAYSGALQNVYQEVKGTKDPRLIVVDRLFSSYLKGPQEAVNIKTAFRSAFIGEEGAAKKKNLRMGNITFHPKYTKVWMDEFLFSEVLGSLADNVYKYAPEETEVYVWFTELSDALQLHIANIGPELFSEELLQIFEGGYRGELARDIEGFGLGLSYARTIMRKYSGDLYHKQHSFSEGGRWAAPTHPLDLTRKSWQQFTVVFCSKIIGG